MNEEMKEIFESWIKAMLYEAAKQVLVDTNSVTAEQYQRVIQSFDELDITDIRWHSVLQRKIREVIQEDAARGLVKKALVRYMRGVDEQPYPQNRALDWFLVNARADVPQMYAHSLERLRAEAAERVRAEELKRAAVLEELGFKREE